MISKTHRGLFHWFAGGALVCLLSAAGAGALDSFDEEEGAPYPYPVPAGLEKPRVPKDNPMSDDKVHLGKLLYFDGRLSRDGSVSCATCHDPKKGWADQAKVSTGIKGQKGTVSAPPVFNSAYYEKQFWDGRAETLEEQAKGPIENPVEMGFTHAEAVKRIAGIKGYSPLFTKAFGDKTVTIDRIAQAIAAFERTVLSGNAPYDQFNAGDKTAMSASAQRGVSLYFGKANCSVCHLGPNFSDSQFHNIGVGMDKPESHLGRFAVTKDEKDRGAFKTPTMRNLSHTAPYMHDGSQATLEEVIDFYNQGGHRSPWLSPDIKPLNLTPEEKKDLIAFLRALDGDPVMMEPPKEFPK